MFRTLIDVDSEAEYIHSLMNETLEENIIEYLQLECYHFKEPLLVKLDTEIYEVTPYYDVKIYATIRER